MSDTMHDVRAILAESERIRAGEPELHTEAVRCIYCGQEQKTVTGLLRIASLNVTTAKRALEILAEQIADATHGCARCPVFDHEEMACGSDAEDADCATRIATWASEQAAIPR